jgi:hypothetical protein
MIGGTKSVSIPAENRLTLANFISHTVFELKDRIGGFKLPHSPRHAYFTVYAHEYLRGHGKGDRTD